MTNRALFAGLCALLIAAAPAQELPGLTVLMGESWIFHIEKGQPAGARRAGSDDKPGEGEIKVTLSRDGGATMIVTNNSGEWYDYRAFISAKPGHKGNRTSVYTLMDGGRMAVETWPEPFPPPRAARCRTRCSASRRGGGIWA